MRLLPSYLAGLVAGAFACAVGPIDESGKACPCGSGWRCDPVSLVCVRGQSAAPSPVLSEDGKAPIGVTPDAGSPADAGTAPASVTVDLSPIADTFLNVNATNYSGSADLNLFTWPDNKVANAILIKFALTAIPAGSTIRSATLKLTLTAFDAYVEPTYTVTTHRIINKDPNLATATGYTFDGVGGWTANACCNAGIPMAQADILPASDTQAIDKTLGTKSFDITSIAQAWVNNGSSNFGVLLNSDASKPLDHWRTFASSENPTVSKRPVLTVTYDP